MIKHPAPLPAADAPDPAQAFLSDPKWVTKAPNTKGMATAAALQVGAMAVGQVFPEFQDPRRLYSVLEAATHQQEPDKKPDRLLTTGVAGAMLSMPPRQVVLLIKSGKLRGTRLGWKSYRVSEASLHKLIAEK